MTSGYWQIPIKEEHREYTAFSTRNGHWEWIRMPFGLTNAPATFQRFMDLCLSPILWKFALAYIDDIIVFSQTFAQHMEHLQQLFDLL